MKTWPKLIGLCVIGFGIGISFRIAQSVIGIFDGDLLWPLAALRAGCALFVGLGCAVYAAREWARRVLLVITVLATLACMTLALPRSIQDGQRDSFFLFLCATEFGDALRLIIPPLFFLLLLSHPDVVRSFRGSKATSDEATQRI